MNGWADGLASLALPPEFATQRRVNFTEIVSFHPIREGTPAMQQYLPHLLNAFLMSAMLISLLCHEAGRIGLVDSPGGRKQHTGDIPVVGGVAMFAAILVTAFTLGELLLQYDAFFVGMSLLVIVGLVDDLKDLGAAIKAMAQIVGALIMTIWGGMIVINLGGIFGTDNFSLPETGIPFTVFCVVGLINALNMADGADGLAGGLSLSALGWLLVAALIGSRDSDVLVLSVLVAAVGGFLVYNMRTPWRPRATVFMGDAGSMMLGFALAWFAVDLSQGPHPAFTPVTVLWILAVPAVDAMIITIKRLVQRRSPFKAGRDHLHHALLDFGFSVQQTVLIIILASVLLGAIGMVGWLLKIPEPVMFILFVGVIALHGAVVSRLQASKASDRTVAVPPFLRARVADLNHSSKLAGRRPRLLGWRHGTWSKNGSITATLGPKYNRLIFTSHHHGRDQSPQ